MIIRKILGESLLLSVVVENDIKQREPSQVLNRRSTTTSIKAPLNPDPQLSQSKVQPKISTTAMIISTSDTNQGLTSDFDMATDICHYLSC